MKLWPDRFWLYPGGRRAAGGVGKLNEYESQRNMAWVLGILIILTSAMYLFTADWFSWWMLALLVVAVVVIVGTGLLPGKARAALAVVVIVLVGLWYMVPKTQYYVKLYVIDGGTYFVKCVLSTRTCDTSSAYMARKERQRRADYLAAVNGGSAQNSASSKPDAVTAEAERAKREAAAAQAKAADEKRRAAEVAAQAERSKREAAAAQATADAEAKAKAEAQAKAEEEKRRAAEAQAKEADEKRRAAETAAQAERSKRELAAAEAKAKAAEAERRKREAAAAEAKAKARAEAKAKAAIKAAVAFLPMCRKGEVASPTVLAQRIRESLAKDPSGNGLVRGCNTTPDGFLAAAKKAGGTVSGVEALPAYLGSLADGEMPSGSITMSRVKYTRDASGKESNELDLERGYARDARKGERGWYDPNTNLLILAGDCSNSPLTPTKGPAAPKQEEPKERAKPPAETPKQTVVPAQCTKPTFYRVRVWEKAAAEVPGVRETMATEAKSVNDYFAKERVSRKFADTFLGLEREGKLKVTSTGHDVVVNHLKKDGSAVQLFKGTVIGMHTGNLPEGFADGDVIQVIPADLSKVQSPPRDLRALHSEFVKCISTFSMIEK